MSVDLPAPFWPISACTSPRPTSRRASTSAGTPTKLLSMPRIDRIGSCGRSVTGAVNGTLAAVVSAPSWPAGEVISSPAGRPAVLLVRLRDVLRGVRLVEQLIAVHDQRRHLLARRV